MSDNRFTSLDVSDDTLAPVAPPTAMVPAPVVTETVQARPLQAGVDVIEPVAEICRAEAALVADVLDMAMPSAYFVNGTKMMDGGEQTAMSHYRSFLDGEAAADALPRLAAIVQAENRTDYKAPLADVYCDRDGIVRRANGGLVLNARAWSQLSNFDPEAMPDHLKAPAGERKRLIDSAIRGNINLWTKHSKKTALFRTRNPKAGVRECYAVMGSRYGVYDIDDVAMEMAKAAPDGSIATTVYEGATAKINVVLQNPYKVDELGVGRLHQVILCAETADDGSSAIRLYFKVLRIACINCTIVQSAKLIFARRHIGQKIAELTAEALSHAGEAMDMFASKWSDAYKADIIDRGTGEGLSRAEIFTRLISLGHIKVPGVERAELLTRCLRAYDREPMPGAAGISAAVSRMAHEDSWKSPWYVDQIEEQASALVFNYAQFARLPDLTEEQRAQF